MHPLIETTPGIAGGKPRITGHRITVEDIVIWHEHQGKSSAQIGDEFDLTPSEVRAALAYYRDHRAEIDHAMEVGRQYVDVCRSSSTSKVAAKLRQRKRSGEAKILHG